MTENNEFASPLNATCENGTARPNTVNGFNYTEIAKLLSTAAGIVIVNSVVFYLFLKRKSLRTTSNYPLFSLALCDFLCGLVVIPLFTILYFTPLVESFKIKFYLGFLVTVLHNFVAIATVYHIVVVTAERYMAIKVPLKHRMIHKKCIHKVLATVWICSLLVSFIPFTWIDKLYPVFHPVCSKLLLGFTVFCLVLALIVPYSFLVFAFVNMFRAINGASSNGSRKANFERRRHSLVQTKSTSERKCLLLFSIMASVFLLCWIPWFVIFLLNQLPNSSMAVPSEVAVLIRYMTSVVNPLLYTFLKRDFLHALKFVFKRYDRRLVSTSFTAFSFRRTTLKRNANDNQTASTPNGDGPPLLAFQSPLVFESAL